MLPNNSSTQEVFIQRHCMQRILHETISSQQKECFGVLIGGGNIITNNIHVTDKVLQNNISVAKTPNNGQALGYYLSLSERDSTPLEKCSHTALLLSQAKLQAPFYYLIIYTDHDGRIDVHMYADSALTKPLTLRMKEDERAKT
ncbi:MAG: hypothetical protein Q9M17_08585 [Mariprofundus sp.]|nr:hypothetical protein [Mariprofundus sp.]